MQRQVGLPVPTPYTFTANRWAGHSVSQIRAYSMVKPSLHYGAATPLPLQVLVLGFEPRFTDRESVVLDQARRYELEAEELRLERRFRGSKPRVLTDSTSPQGGGRDGVRSRNHLIDNQACYRLHYASSRRGQDLNLRAF